MITVSKIATVALLATLVWGCASDHIRSTAEFAEAQELAQTYDVRYIEIVEAKSESRRVKVIWVHPPYAAARFDYSLPIKIPVMQKPPKPESADTNE